MSRLSIKYTLFQVSTSLLFLFLFVRFVCLFVSLNACLLAHHASVHRHLWAVDELGKGSHRVGKHRRDALCSQKANYCHFLLTTAWLQERGPEGILVWVKCFCCYDHGTQVTSCLYRMCSYRHSHEIWFTRWFVTKQRWLEILYQNQWVFALAQDTLNTRISLFFDSCCLRIPVLSLHLHLEITASQKMSLCYVPGKSCKGHYYTTDCWVELGNNAKLPAGKSHYYTNAKTGTRCGK